MLRPFPRLMHPTQARPPGRPLPLESRASPPPDVPLSAARSVVKQDAKALAYQAFTAAKNRPWQYPEDTELQPSQDILRFTPRRLSHPKSGEVLTASDRMGRPELNQPQNLLWIWAFIEVNRKLGGRSVLAICAAAEFQFGVVGGDPCRDRRLRGVTLRRRYYEAKAFLQKHIDDHAENLAFFAANGAKASFLTETCDLERFWRAELNNEMSLHLRRKSRLSAQHEPQDT